MVQNDARNVAHAGFHSTRIYIVYTPASNVLSDTLYPIRQICKRLLTPVLILRD